jgi:hypothetical protein
MLTQNYTFSNSSTSIFRQQNLVTGIINNYRQQPSIVTINNIYKEWPQLFPPKEALMNSGVKVYLRAIATHMFAPAMQLSADKITTKEITHELQFIDNFGSAVRKTFLWGFKFPRGTRTYTFDLVVADVLSGACRVYLKVYLNSPALLTNGLCETMSSMVMVSTEKVANRNGNIYSLAELSAEALASQYWSDVLQKAVASTITPWLIAKYFIVPVENVVKHSLAKVIPQGLQVLLGHDWALKDLPLLNSFTKKIASQSIIKNINGALSGAINAIPLAGRVLSKVEIANFVWLPSIANYMLNVAIGVVMLPIVRIFTYNLNPKLEVIVEHAGNITCMKIGDVLALSENNTIASIEYKYDALKANISSSSDQITCEYNNKKVSFDLANIDNYKQDKLVVHYPGYENFVLDAQNSFDICMVSSFDCLNLLKDKFINGFDQLKQSIASLATSKLFAAVVTYISIEAAYFYFSGNSLADKTIDMPYNNEEFAMELVAVGECPEY